MSAKSMNAIAAPIPNAEFWKLWLYDRYAG
jgi:hypothetical protein